MRRICHLVTLTGSNLPLGLLEEREKGDTTGMDKVRSTSKLDAIECSWLIASHQSHPMMVARLGFRTNYLLRSLPLSRSYLSEGLLLEINHAQLL